MPWDAGFAVSLQHFPFRSAERERQRKSQRSVRTCPEAAPLPTGLAAWQWWRRMAQMRREHPQWKRHPFFEAQRKLPRR